MPYTLAPLYVSASFVAGALYSSAKQAASLSTSIPCLVQPSNYCHHLSVRARSSPRIGQRLLESDGFHFVSSSRANPGPCLPTTLARATRFCLISNWRKRGENARPSTVRASAGRSITAYISLCWCSIRSTAGPPHTHSFCAPANIRASYDKTSRKRPNDALRIPFCNAEPTKHRPDDLYRSQKHTSRLQR